MTWSEKMKTPEALTLQKILEIENEWKLKISYDLGCGFGVDTIPMLEHGWKVNAIDPQNDVKEWFEKNCGAYKKHLNFVQKSFTKISWQPSELINASFSLPFCPKNEFDSLWDNIHQSLITDGFFCGQFFGIRDDWKENPMLNFHSREDILLLTEGFEIVQFLEIEKLGPSLVEKSKHWHIFHLVLKKI